MNEAKITISLETESMSGSQNSCSKFFSLEPFERPANRPIELLESLRLFGSIFGLEPIEREFCSLDLKEIVLIAKSVEQSQLPSMYDTRVLPRPV